MTIKYSEIFQNLQGQKDPIQEIFFLPLMTRMTESGQGDIPNLAINISAGGCELVRSSFHQYLKPLMASASISISISQLGCDVGYSRLINIFEAFDVVNIIRPLLAVDIVDIATVFPPPHFCHFPCCRCHCDCHQDCAWRMGRRPSRGTLGVMRREGKKGGGGKSGGKRRGWSEWEKNVWKIGMRCSTLISTLISTQIGGLIFLGKVQRDFGIPKLLIPTNST